MVQGERSCDHDVVDDVCWRCTVRSMRPFPAGEPVIGQAEADRVAAVLASGRLTQGPVVAEFETRLGARQRCHAVAVCNGTVAVHLALLAAVGQDPHLHWPEAEVLVPDLSFVATANAVTYTGARPVLVDIDPSTWAMSLIDARRKVTARTVAMIAVDLYGRPAPLSAMRAFCDEHGLALVLDAAESFGSVARGGAAALADTVSVSFYGNKVLTTGEGGAVFTESSVTDRYLRLLRGQGQGARRFVHEVVGYNARMTEMQAAVGCAQLDRLDEALAARHRVFHGYRRVFGAALGWAFLPPDATPWQAAVITPEGVDVSALAEALEADGIETRPMFTPMHALPMYRRPDEQFPEASRVARRVLALPTSARMTSEEAAAVGAAVLQVARSL